MTGCAARNCTNQTDKARETNKTFHRFPKDPVKRKQWVVALKREDFEPSESARLCCDHFTESCFDRTGQTIRLRENAVPTVFHFTEHLQKKRGHRKPPTNRATASCSNHSTDGAAADVNPERVNPEVPVVKIARKTKGNREHCSILGCAANTRPCKSLTLQKLPKSGLDAKTEAWREELLSKISRTDQWFMKEKEKTDANIFICQRHFKDECFKPSDIGGDEKEILPFSVPTEHISDMPATSADFNALLGKCTTVVVKPAKKMRPKRQKTAASSSSMAATKKENSKEESLEVWNELTPQELKRLASEELVSKFTAFTAAIQAKCNRLTEQLSRLSLMHKQKSAEWEDRECELRRQCESVRDSMCAALDARLQELLLEVRSTRHTALQPLTDQRRHTVNNVDTLTALGEQASKILSSQPENNPDKMIELMTKPQALKFDRFNKELPRTSDLTQLVLQATTGLEEKLRSLLTRKVHVTTQSPVCVVDVIQTSAGLTVQWAQEKSCGYSQFQLQQAVRDGSGEGGETNFHKLYEGPANSVSISADPGSCRTFRVRGRRSPVAPWSSWSPEHNTIVDLHQQDSGDGSPVLKQESAEEGAMSVTDSKHCGKLENKQEYSVYLADPDTSSEDSTLFGIAELRTSFNNLSNLSTNLQTAELGTSTQGGDQLNNSNTSGVKPDLQSMSSSQQKTDFVIKRAKNKQNTNKAKCRQKCICELCQEKFFTQASLKVHMWKKHSAEKPFPCDECSSAFVRGSSLKIHKEMHKSQQTCSKHWPQASVDCEECERLKSKATYKWGYSCDSCQSVFLRQQDLKRHLRKKNSAENPFPCNECDATFLCATSLSSHKIKHMSQQASACSRHMSEASADCEECRSASQAPPDQEVPCVCDVCGRDFKLLSDLKTHLQVHSSSDFLNLNKFHCTYCPAEFSRLFLLNQHLGEHGECLPFVCDRCGVGFSLPCHLKAHMRSHSEEKPHACPHCSATFKTRNAMKCHETKHRRHPRFHCTECPKRLTSRNSLNLHMRIHSGSKPYACKFCEAAFRQRNHLRRHLLTHSGEKPHSCDVCGVKFRLVETLKTHKRKHTGEKPYACDQCDGRFSQASGLKLHKLRHSDEAAFSCEQCGMKFKYPSNFKYHKMTHSGQKPFSCDQCGTLFTTSIGLKGHMKKHSLENPFRCEYCGKCFRGSQSLQIHTRNHTGEKPFMCSVCGSSFKQRAHLTRHFRTHTGERPYVCKCCGASYNDKFLLDVHVRKHTGERPYACDKCSATFTGYHALKAHRKKHMSAPV